jgi:hypothetical protein
MKKTLLLIVLLMTAVGLADPGAQAPPESRLLRFPAIHGNQVVFTYAGDLFTVPATGGVARRLTSDVGFEMFARFSPDGKTLAFTGQYDGNTEVYVMPAQGGVPKRRCRAAASGSFHLTATSSSTTASSANSAPGSDTAAGRPTMCGCTISGRTRRPT